MFHRKANCSAKRASDLGPVLRAGPGDLAVPGRACCCPARPLVKVIMPATRSRPHPVDLWLCGHHYRASREALEASGARVYWLAAPDYEPLGTTSGASHVSPR